MGDRLVVLFTRGGVKLLKYLIQLLNKDHLQVFLKTIFITPHVKTLTQLIMCFCVSNFSAASFNFITSSRVTVLNLDVILALIENQEMFPWQFGNFTCEIIN